MNTYTKLGRGVATRGPQSTVLAHSLGAAPFAFKGAVFPGQGKEGETVHAPKACTDPLLGTKGGAPAHTRRPAASRVLDEMSNPLLVLSGRKKPCASRRFFGIRESRHHLTGTEGANSIIFWAI